MFHWLALASMVWQPPLRGDWGDFKCTGDWNKATQLHPDPEDNRNYLYQKNGQFNDRQEGRLDNRYVMCINYDKVSEKKGSDQILCSLAFSDALTTSFKLWPRAYAFCKQDDAGKPLLNMPQFLASIKDPRLQSPTYGDSLHQGTQLLHNSYVKWFYNRTDPIPDHNAKMALARSMRHNWTVAETHYRKLDIQKVAETQFDEEQRRYVLTGNLIDERDLDAPNLVMNPLPIPCPHFDNEKFS